jgi:hypothetical protein
MRIGAVIATAMPATVLSYRNSSGAPTKARPRPPDSTMFWIETPLTMLWGDSLYVFSARFVSSSIDLTTDLSRISGSLAIGAHVQIPLGIRNLNTVLPE